MRVLPFIAVLALLTSCEGPEAEDAVVCRDVIERLCRTPLCTATMASLAVSEDDCTETLLARTGCGDDGFAFASPSRERFLECRLPLLRNDSARGAAPLCEDVEEVFDRCDDVAGFLRAAAP